MVTHWANKCEAISKIRYDNLEFRESKYDIYFQKFTTTSTHKNKLIDRRDVKKNEMITAEREAYIFRWIFQDFVKW